MTARRWMIAKRYTFTPGCETPIAVGRRFHRGLRPRQQQAIYERALHAENSSSLYEPFDSKNQIPQGGHDSLDRLRQI